MRSTAWPAAVPLAMAELAPRVRSALFTPGTDAARLRKAVTVGADVCIFDLEDSVPLQRATEARQTVSRALGELHGRGRIWVRVHPPRAHKCRRTWRRSHSTRWMPLCCPRSVARTTSSLVAR